MEGPEAPNIHDTFAVDKALNIYEVINWPFYEDSHFGPLGTPLRNAAKAHSCSQDSWLATAIGQAHLLLC